MLLYGIFRDTISPGMSFTAFDAYYNSSSLQYIDITFSYCEGALAGFCSAAFYTMNVNSKAIALGRVATGIREEYRGKGLPKWKLFMKYAQYKMKHPFTSLLLSVYVMNPILYAMICKYTAQVWPKKSINVPHHIAQVKNEIIKNSDVVLNEEEPFLVKINFTVAAGKKMVEAVLKSKNKHIRYFLGLNKYFPGPYGIVVIIPFTWRNIIFSSLIFAFYFCKVLWSKPAKYVAIKWKEVHNFIHIIFPKTKSDP